MSSGNDSSREGGPSADRVRAILDERARRLARPPEDPDERSEELEVVTFVVGRERFALETRYVSSVHRLRAYAPLPGAPAVFFGLTHFHGQMLPLVDLRRLLGLETRDLTDLSWVLVLGEADPELGILADDVSELESVAVSELSDLPAIDGEAGHGCRKAFSDTTGLVLDGASLLRDPRLFIDDGGPSKAWP